MENFRRISKTDLANRAKLQLVCVARLFQRATSTCRDSIRSITASAWGAGRDGEDTRKALSFCSYLCFSSVPLRQCEASAGKLVPGFVANLKGRKAYSVSSPSCLWDAILQATTPKRRWFGAAGGTATTAVAAKKETIDASMT